MTAIDVVDDRVLKALYETALHDGQWGPALQLASEQLNCAEVCLTTAVQGGAVGVYETTRRLLSDAAFERYDNYYWALDPKMRLLGRRGGGFVFNDADHFDDAFVARDPFYQEFTRWVGLRHTLDMALGAGAGQPAFLAVMRTAAQGPFQRSSERDFRRLAGHVGRVHGLRARIDSLEAKARYAEAALEGIAYGLAVLDACGRTVLANSRARRLSAEAGPLGHRHGRIAARWPAADRELQAMIERALAGQALAAASMRIERPDAGDCILWVMRLPPTSALAQGAPAVLILIGDPQPKGRVRQADLMRLYGLTPAEAELALALAGGRSLKEAARVRGVSYATVRVQLAALLDKTGLHRQTELTRLIAGLPGAILDDPAP